MLKNPPEKVVHGGQKRFLEEKYGSPCIDFSASLNPFPPRFEWVVDAEDLGSYPDDTYTRLKETIGHLFHRNSEEITVGNGSIEVIRTFCSCTLGDGARVMVETPTFGEYGFSAALAGAVCVPSPEGASVRFLCNPNNPTGILRTKAEARDVLESIRYPAHLFVDEAFIELSDPRESVSDIQDDRLFVARSLTKSFAVPGIRFGYGFGSPDLVEKMEAQRLPWSVNVYAEAFALQAFRHYDALQASREAIERERAWIFSQCRDRDIACSPSRANFLLLYVPFAAREMEARLLTRGILVRDCASFGLPTAIRVAVRTHEENRILMEGLTACLP